MMIYERIRQLLKSRFDALNSSPIRKNALNALPYWLGAFVVGLSAVLYAALFSLAESLTAKLFQQASWMFFFVTPAAFVFAWWVVVKYAPFAAGSGIPQVHAAIELSNPRHRHKVNKLLSIRIALVKVLSSLVMVLGGGAIGREGPTIQIAASAFKVINGALPKWYPKISKQNMIVTGAAAGLASAFNTPLGGIVFAIEELTKTHFSFFKSALLTGVIIAGLTSLYMLGPYLYLGYPKLDDIPLDIVIAIVPVAVVAGVFGSFSGRVILYVLKYRDTLKRNYQKVIFVVLCGLVVASLAYFIDWRALGSGKGIIVSSLFTGPKHLTWYMPIVRILGSIVSFSAGAAGGIFAPALNAGASIGAVYAGLLHVPGTEYNLLVLCGMVGFLTAITQSPFTSSILVIEMTNSHNVIFYLMLTALLAHLAANVISRHSLYEHLSMRYLREIEMLDQTLTDDGAAGEGKTLMV